MAVDYLTLDVANERLSISRRTAARMLAAGTYPVPAFKVGREWRIRASDLDEKFPPSQPTRLEHTLALLAEIEEGMEHIIATVGRIGDDLHRELAEVRAVNSPHVENTGEP